MGRRPLFVYLQAIWPCGSREPTQYNIVAKGVVHPIVQTTPPSTESYLSPTWAGRWNWMEQLSLWTTKQFSPTTAGVVAISFLADYQSLVSPAALSCWLAAKSTRLCRAWHPFSCRVKASLACPLSHWLVVESLLSWRTAPNVLC